MTTQIDINVIAYVEEPRKWAAPIATFASEQLYLLCAPVIERYIADHFNGGSREGDCILTESCELDILVEVDA